MEVNNHVEWTGPVIHLLYTVQSAFHTREDFWRVLIDADFFRPPYLAMQIKVKNKTTVACR